VDQPGWARRSWHRWPLDRLGLGDATRLLHGGVHAGYDAARWLRLPVVAERHTGQNILDRMQACFAKYNFVPYSLTRDGGANIVRACELGNFDAISCAAHVAARVIAKFLDKLDVRWFLSWWCVTGMHLGGWRAVAPREIIHHFYAQQRCVEARVDGSLRFCEDQRRNAPQAVRDALEQRLACGFGSD
jgi:hypothetical protein